MKYSGHESFSIRKNWLQKGIRKIDAFTKNDFETMDELGLGRNMVKSLRYWLKATGLSEDEPKKKHLQLSPLGKIIMENDPYIQETGTLCLLQYNLASNKENATSWYYLFNEFNMTEFSEEDFCRSLQKWDEMNNTKKAAISSFQKDFDCIRRTYISRSENYEDPESNMDSPFAELGLLNITEKNELKKMTPLKSNIPAIILFSLILKMHGNEILKQSVCRPACRLAEQVEVHNNSSFELKLSSLLNDKCSPGKIFNMDSILLMNLLSELENKNFLEVVRTAGLDVVRIKNNITFEECVNQYYKELKNE